MPQEREELIDTELIVGREGPPEQRTPNPYLPFLKELEEGLRKKLPNELANFRASAPKKDTGKWYAYSEWKERDYLYFQSYFRTRGVDISLVVHKDHVDLVEGLQAQEAEIEAQLGARLESLGQKLVRIGEWIEWSKKAEELESEELLEKVTDRMVKYIEILKPKIDAILYFQRS